jgi:hypothetical protein
MRRVPEVSCVQEHAPRERAVSDLDEFRAVEAVVRTDAPLPDGMRAPLDFCDRRLPDPVWADLRGLDWERDLSALQGWLRGVLVREPPPAACAALYFGLGDWEDSDDPKNDLICRMYVGGASRFVPGGEVHEWAGDLMYSPDGLADSEVLTAVYRRVRRRPDAVLMLGAYVLCLGYAGLAVRRLCDGMTDLLLATADTRGIAVDFDEGDALLLGVLGRTGWL